MNEFKPAAALREFDRLAARDDTPQALAWLRAQRARFMALPDAVLRARFMLRAGSLRDSDQPIQQLIDALLLALGIFRSQGLSAETAHTLARLSYWYHRQGLLAPALISGWQALARPELSPPERTRLQVVLVSSLAMQRLMADAWAMLADVDANRLPRPETWMLTAARAHLHLIEAMRARRLVSVFTLDQPPDLAPDADAAERHLAACERLLAQLPARVLVLPVQTYMRAVCRAMRSDRAGTLAAMAEARGLGLLPGGQLSQAVMLYNEGWCLRVLGDVVQAGERQRTALALMSDQAASRLQSLVSLELAECARLQGDAAQALAWMDQLVRLLMQLRTVEHEAAAMLAKALDPPAGASRTGGRTPNPQHQVPVTAQPQGAEGEPALLTRAEALFLARLPRRLPLPALAAELGVSIRTLQLGARRHRQCTLGEMLRAQVMVRARSLLRESELSISEIAAALGYQDASSLSRDVRRHFGCTPRMLRAALPVRLDAAA